MDLPLLAGFHPQDLAAVLGGQHEPVALEGVLPQGFLQVLCRHSVARGALLVLVLPGADLREGIEHVHEELRQPDGLAFPLYAHAVQAVVPVPLAHQRKPARAEPLQDALYGSQAMLVDGARAAVIIGGFFFKYPGIRRFTYVAGHYEREPEQVVGDIRKPAFLRDRMPPMLHGAVLFLVGRMLFYLGLGPGRVQHEVELAVLQLVPEAESSAALVVGGPAQQPAGDGLVFKPVIYQRVHGGLGGFDDEPAAQFQPMVPGLFQHRLRFLKRLDVSRIIFGESFMLERAQHEVQVFRLSGGQFQVEFHGDDRLETHAGPAGQRTSLFQEARVVPRVVRAEDLLLVAGERRGFGAGRENGRERPPFVPAGVAGQRRGPQVGIGQYRVVLFIEAGFYEKIVELPVPVRENSQQ